jgi:hypothetical protein
MQCYENPANVKCINRCEKSCEAGHQCPLKCYQKCAPCKTEVKKVVPDCGHVALVRCHETPTRTHCQQPCERQCENGHTCKQKCSQPCAPCWVVVEKTLPCGHEQDVLAVSILKALSVVRSAQKICVVVTSKK